ncbi:MAG TPA: phytoene/squalene synthase family protein [Solirubrobacteraceae bacterium]|jgi:phytoene synthase|nr:phytoene/squalene synthase family protein [Solirubrobacteraceae bacterium]
MTGEPMDLSLDRSYDTCRRMHRRHDPTYYWATRRLPAEIRPATHALYGYVRTADEIVDGPRRPASAEARRAALDAWERELQRGLAAGRSPNPVVGALVDAGRRHRLPLEELRTYMRSMRIDCAPVRIETWPELESYMDGSAGSVGRIMAALLGVPERHHAGFGQLGRAFQLANFIRDVREDAGLDRVYLPAEDRARFGVGEEHLTGPHASPELRALLAHEVRRARGLFAASEPAIAAAPGSVRSGVRFAVGIYLRVLVRVERIDFDVLGRRAGVRAWQVPGAALGALRR